MTPSQPRIHFYTFCLLVLSLLTFTWTASANAQDPVTASANIIQCDPAGNCPNPPANYISVWSGTWEGSGPTRTITVTGYCPSEASGQPYSHLSNQQYDPSGSNAGMLTSATCVYEPPQCEPPTIGSYPDCLCPSGMVKPPAGVGLNSVQCVDAVEDPTDCASDPVFDTAISVEGQYMCGAADDGCPDGFDLGTAYNSETGTSVNTCNDGWTDDSSSSSSDSSSSSGSSSSDGDDSGGDSSSSDSETDNSSSSSSSSSQGTDCDPATETCDNEASGGEDCSAPPSCTGDSIACAQLKQEWLQRCPGSELGELNGIEHSLDIETRTQQAVDEYNEKFNEIAGQFEELVSVHFNGTSAAIPSNTQTLKGQEVELGPAARKDFFDIIRNLLYFGCLLFAFYIIMRAN